jgi:hypothetical protein
MGPDFKGSAVDLARDMEEFRQILGGLTVGQKLRLLMQVRSEGFPEASPGPLPETSGGPPRGGRSGH